MKRSIYLFATLGVAACGTEAVGPSGRLDVAVASLTLPGVGRVCYDIAVVNGATNPVWSRGTVGTSKAGGDTTTLCSDQFGNGGGGDISYVGPCDASEPTHTVTLWVDTIADESLAPMFDWQDPCPSGCALEAECAENADTPVVFNLVVMRAANQGFFDIAVNFEDVFCSAKLDCTYDDAGTQPITLLHPPGTTDGTRGQTAVIGFACTGGPDDNATVLHVSGVQVDCEGGAAAPALLASISIVSGDDGDAFGFDVVSDQSLPNVSKVNLTPRHWVKTGDGAWAQSVQLEMVPGKDSAQVVYHLDDDHVYGPAFNADNFWAGDTSYTGEQLAIWKRVSGAWSLNKVGDVINSLLGDGATLIGVEYYDAAIDRAFLATNFSNGIAGYWDVESDDGPIALSLPVGPYTNCSGVDARGDVVVALCDQKLVAWDLTAGTVGEEIGLPFALGGPFWVDELTVDDGAIIALMGDEALGQRYLVRWTGGAGAWVATLVDFSLGIQSGDHWSRDAYIYSEHNHPPDLYRSTGLGLGHWNDATFDGSPVVGSWNLTGIATAPGGQEVVYGYVSNGVGEVPVAGVLPASGQPIPLVSLPFPSGGSGNVRATFDAGVHGQDLVLYGNDDPGSPSQRVLELFWMIDAGGATFVRDWRVLDGPFGSSGFPEVEHNRREGRTVAAVVKPVSNLSRAWDIYAPGAPGSHVASAPLDRAPLGGGGGSASSVSLDPTILGNGWTIDPDPSDAVWQYQIYRGVEDLLCDGVPCDKLYWNASIGFDPTIAGCTLHFEATAGDKGDFRDGYTPADTTYPYLSYSVALTDDNGDMVCRRNSLDADDDDTQGVTSVYTGLEEQHHFCHHFNGRNVRTSPGCGQSR